MMISKRLIASFAAALTVASISMTASAAAAAAQTPAEVLSGLIGKTVEAVNSEWAAGKSYAAIADEAGKLTEFRQIVCNGNYHDACGYGYNHAVCGAAGTGTSYGRHHGGGHRGCCWR